MVQMTPTAILGKWLHGVALDVHTVSSTYQGDDADGRPQFQTRRSALGDLLYRLKYRQDRSAVAPLVEAAVTFLGPHRAKFDIIVPVPPSTRRAIQPVLVIAQGVGVRLGKPVCDCVSTGGPTQQIKAVEDPVQRATLKHGLYRVDAGVTSGRHVLLLDDLYRSGTTLNAITEVLMGQGRAQSVRVLTLTRTRINR
ncbi:ComF family protein [Roseospira goensis]|uniref:Putative amidophosphoribosyltransferase n=1 Tax=Roseospira goensis TaxID=391922 RepID=A0A7W6WJU5_9PROT|nr:phosphoribosyltransferase family protein [Roseospira goensis]MBB4285014.1 putative amidophosphoribosyltransferase [Roseospira goensis]